MVVLALDRDRAPAVERQIRQWQTAGEELHAPALLPYEVANALVRGLAAGQLAPDNVIEAWQLLAAIPVVLHQLQDGPAVIELAGRLQRRSAYDAAYVQLAEQLGADLWTLDGPLARNATARGLSVTLLDTTPGSVLLASVPRRPCEFGFPGPLRDRLVAAVLQGSKTATSSLLADWERDDEPLPFVGELQTVVDSDDAPVATIEIVAVEVTRLGSVDDRVAQAEGESYSTAAGWRAEHERFWTEEVLSDWGDNAPVLDDDTQVVVQWFRVQP